MDKRTGIALIVGAVAVAAVFVVVAAIRDLTPLENVLMQMFSLGFGVVGSYVLGRESARKAAKEMVKPHARSAFRRLLSLYKSLSRLAYAIQATRQNGTASQETINVLDKLESIVIEQIATADDALEDWRDIVPEDVEELRSRISAQPSVETKK